MDLNPDLFESKVHLMAIRYTVLRLTSSYMAGVLQTFTDQKPVLFACKVSLWLHTSGVLLDSTTRFKVNHAVLDMVHEGPLCSAVVCWTVVLKE